MGKFKWGVCVKCWRHSQCSFNTSYALWGRRFLLWALVTWSSSLCENSRSCTCVTYPLSAGTGIKSLHTTGYLMFSWRLLKLQSHKNQLFISPFPLKPALCKNPWWGGLFLWEVGGKTDCSFWVDLKLGPHGTGAADRVSRKGQNQPNTTDKKASRDFSETWGQAPNCRWHKMGFETNSN